MSPRSPAPPLRPAPPGAAGRAVGLLLAAAVLLWPVLAAPVGHHPGRGVGDLVGWRAVIDGAVLTAVGSSVDADLLLRQGYPLEALLLSPLLAAVPWPLAVNLAVWILLALVGLSAAALAGRLTGSGPAALLAGIAWQTTATARTALEGAAFGVLLGLALLPLILWAGLRAVHTRDPRRAALAGGLGGLLLLLRCGGGVWLGALLLLSLPALRRASRALLPPALVAALLVSLPVLAWTWGQPSPGLPLAEIPWTLLLLGLLAAALLDPRRPRARLPLALLLLGLLGVGGWSAALSLVELGVLLWLVQALLGRPWLSLGCGVALLLGWGVQWGGLPVTTWTTGRPGVVLVVPPAADGLLVGAPEQWTAAQKQHAAQRGAAAAVVSEGAPWVWIPAEEW